MPRNDQEIVGRENWYCAGGKKRAGLSIHPVARRAGARKRCNRPKTSNEPDRFCYRSFKIGSDDLRESPRVAIAEQFIGKGLNLLVYDPDVHLSRLLGANRRFIEQHVPHIASLMSGDIESVVAESDLLVVRLSSVGIFDALARNVREDQIVLDLVNMPRREAPQASVIGLCW